MSTRSQRGRIVRTKTNASARNLYIGAAVAVVIGLVVLIALVANPGSSTSVAGNAPEGIVPVKAPLNLPTGQTAEQLYYKGNSDAPVTVIDYSDYQCPACAYYATNIGTLIEQNYIATGKVKFIYSDFPLQQHRNAVPASLAARCAGDQNAYWQMHDMLFANQRQWSTLTDTRNQFATYARQLNLDVSAFTSCLANPGTHQDTVNAALQRGVQAQVNATPTFSVNGKLTDMEGLAPAIEAALAGR